MRVTLHRIVFAITFSLLLGNFSHADVLDDAMRSAMDDCNIRGASVAYFNRNSLSEPIIRSYGKVSSDDRSEDVNPETVFMIASVSKLFAGTAVLKLVSQGIINLDDDICNVLPENYAKSACVNPFWPNTPVTWRMLVTHRSSLRESIPTINNETEAAYGPTGGYVDGTAGGNPTCPLMDVVGFYRDFMIDKTTETSVGSGLGVNWFQVNSESGGSWEEYEPGSKTLYSNFAIGYIASLIEFASGKSFPDYCRDNIFVPLGMNNTAWFRKDLPDGVLEAVPVEYFGEDEAFDDTGHYCFIDYASGSLRISANDLSIFLNSMLNFGAPMLWPEEVGKTALQCAERIDNIISPGDCEYGITWNILTKKTAESWLEHLFHLDWSLGGEHAGLEAGSQTQVILLPGAGIYALVLTNTDGNDDMAAQILTKELLLKAPEIDGLLGSQRSSSSAVTRLNQFLCGIQAIFMAIMLIF